MKRVDPAPCKVCKQMPQITEGGSSTFPIVSVICSGNGTGSRAAHVLRTSASTRDEAVKLWNRTMQQR